MNRLSKIKLMKNMFKKYGLYNNYSKDKQLEVIEEYLNNNKDISELEIMMILTKLINHKKNGIGKGFFYK